MEFEYNHQKSIANKKKHGIDFEDAQELWKDPDRLEVPARVTTEIRYLLIARIASGCWTAVFTYRGAVTRIISVRKSRKEEEKAYESYGF